MRKTQTKQAQAKIPQKRARRVRRKHVERDWLGIFLRGLFWVLVLGFVGACVWVFLFWSASRVTQIDVSGTERLSAETVQRVVEEELSGMWFDYVPRAQYVLVDTDRIGERVAEVSGAVRAVEVRKTFPNRVSVQVTEWTHVYVWCVQSQDQCVVIEDDGSAGRDVSAGEAIVRDNPVTYVVEQSDVALPVWGTALEVTPAYLESMIAAFEASGLPLEDDVIYTAHRRAGSLTFQTREGWELIVGTAQSPTDVRAAVASVLTYGMTASERADLERVDVRLGHKVFYQTRAGREAAEVAAAEAAKARAEAEESAQDAVAEDGA